MIVNNYQEYEDYEPDEAGQLLIDALGTGYIICSTDAYHNLDWSVAMCNTTGKICVIADMEFPIDLGVC